MTTEPREITDLIAALDHPDKPTIRAAVDKLIALAETSETLRQALHNRLSEADHRNYWPVAYILGHQARPSGVVIRTLLDALDHREPDIRWANGLLLVRIAQQEGAVVPLLVELCVTGSANQKRMALYCLRDLALHDAVESASNVAGVGRRRTDSARCRRYQSESENRCRCRRPAKASSYLFA